LRQIGASAFQRTAYNFFPVLPVKAGQTQSKYIKVKKVRFGSANVARKCEIHTKMVEIMKAASSNPVLPARAAMGSRVEAHLGAHRTAPSPLAAFTGCKSPAKRHI
jgi:hypothetical protein